MEGKRRSKTNHVDGVFRQCLVIFFQALFQGHMVLCSCLLIQAMKPHDPLVGGPKPLAQPIQTCLCRVIISSPKTS